VSRSQSSVGDPRLLSLERYRSQLETLLAMLDGEDPPLAEAIAGAWERCQQSFAVYQGQEEKLALEPCSSEVQEAIKESMRLNAVAVSELVRHKAELFDRKGELKRQQAMLDSQRSLPQKGRSCDLSG